MRSTIVLCAAAAIILSCASASGDRSHGSTFIQHGIPRGGANARALAAKDASSQRHMVEASPPSQPPPTPHVALSPIQRVSTMLLVSSVVEFLVANEKVLKTLFAGAVSGIISRSATSPLEVIATMQMSGYGLEGGLVQQLKTLYANEGLTGFFKGNGANCLKVAPTRAIQFAVYERLKSLIVRYRKVSSPACTDVTLSPFGRLFAGGLAGQVSATCVYPLEVIKTMLTVNPGAYGGILDAFSKALEEGGVPTLFKGWLPTIVAMFPYVGIEFMIYETLKLWYQRVVQNYDPESGTTEPALPGVVHFMLGALAGAAAQTAAHPLDVVRRRLQLQGKGGRPVVYHNMFDGIYMIIKDEGWASLYRGLRPACAEKVPSTAITYVVYELLKSALGLRSI